jgi:hypothetical protein
VDTNGVEYHDPRRVSVEAWWSVYAALALLVVAVAITVRLLPNGLPIVKRLARSLSSSRVGKRGKGHAHL